jgi:glutamate-5-semialdehyde dehydrogenase
MARRLALGARTASRVLAKASAAQRESALRAVARFVSSDAPRILEANRADMEAAKSQGLPAPMQDRLRLDRPRLETIAKAITDVADLPDPIGAMEALTRRPNGLLVGKMRIPLGVILIVYEARPNVTTDAFALCLKAGNATILRGGKESIHSNQALAAAISAGLEESGLPSTAAQIAPTTDRALMDELLQCDDDIDLVIPRGGEGLIRYIAERSRIPVIKHYKGVCHVYVDAAADTEMALAICENAKVQRPGVCNSCETILVHQDIAATMVPALVAHLGQKGVEIRGDAKVRELGGPAVVDATEEDWGTEYLALIVAMRVVPSLDAAVEHIERYGSSHTEAIVTRDYAASRRFLDTVSSSTVVVNASTRFADGGELGLGAEIGISTTKLHAYGPMGVRELTATKFVVFGDGQVRR